MSTERSSTRRLGRRAAGRWVLPAASVLAGGIVWAAAAIGGHPALGAVCFAIMAGYAAVLVFGRRSDIIRVLGGDPADERWHWIDVRATAFAGGAVIFAIIAAFVWELAHGRNGQAFANLGAIAGGSYVAALIWQRWRS